MKEFFECLFIFLAGCFLLLMLDSVRACAKLDAVSKKDHSSKCFEQTQDKQCWGIK
jgi:hypothetical protein